MALLDDVKTIVTNKLKDLGAVDNALLEMAVEEVQFSITDYCNINSIPVELKYTWANMSEDNYRYYKALATPQQTSTVTLGDVSQLKIGDTTINVDASKNTSQSNKALKSHNSNLDVILRNYTQQLNKHRRMVW